MINYDAIVTAQDRIRSCVYNTPFEKSWYLSKLVNGEVFLKLECQQIMKSFKTRGVFNKLLSLSQEEKNKTIVTVSSGNHGAALSYAANLLGLNSVEVFVPEVTPEAKKEKIRRYGAKLTVKGRDYDDTYELVEKEFEGKDVIWVDSSSDEEIIHGQGTIALEILDLNSDIEYILVPIGGGGIITGISIAAKRINPNIKIIGVQPEACPSMAAAMRDNIFYKKYPSEESSCEALVGGIGEIPFKLAKDCIDEVLLVKEETIRKAVIELLENDKILSEPSAAVGAACLMEYPDKFKNKNTAIIITGGNIDIELLKSYL